MVIKVRSWAILKVPRLMAVEALSKVTLPVPVVVKLTAPVIVVELRTISFDPALKLAAPLIVRFPLSVIAPAAVMSKFPVTVDAPRSRAPELTTVTLAPVTSRVPILFEVLVNVTSCPLADIFNVPETFSAPVWVIAPPAIKVKSPDNVMASSSKLPI